ncbi:hypothetical protein FQR65_LT13254 [Abscondita terminalis]|nr:hypothetical protein FQR65_LT13254 [Abscondita terminalis]
MDKLNKRKNDKENGKSFDEAKDKASSVKLNNNMDNKRSNNNSNGKSVDEVKDKIVVRSGELPIKVFENRKSVLTELFENKHLSSVYHIFMSFFICMCMSSFVRDYLYNGEMRLGYNLISKGFRNMHLMMIAWFLIFFLSVIPYYGIKYWAKIRTTIKEKSLRMYLWDRTCLVLYISHLFGMLYLGTIIVLKWHMGFVAGLSSILETLRLIMKVYSFGRVCISRVLNQPEKYSKQHPNFSKYMYFSFAPTLLYRDNYPRLPGNIRWGRVVVYFLEFVASIALLSMMFESVFIRQLQSYGSTHLSINDIVMFMLNSAPFGLLSMFTLNYIVLHVWLNAFAEMLRFSDRLFYKDWWTSDTYERFYRTWNTVVHDWLYTALPSGKLPSKLFRNRLSVLTEMFENKHFLSAYHIIVTIFLVIWINSLLRDYLYNEEVRLGFNLISKGFKNAHIMTMGWLLLFFLSMVPYYGIRYWGNGGRILNHKWKLFWNRGWLVLYLLHFLGTLYCGTVIVFNGDMGLLAGITIMLEMFRLIMKVYSFGRVCISRVLNQPEKYSDQHPKISQYVYFLFAPTLLYRDNYPKIPGKIRWGYVAVCAIEFVIAIASLAIICENKIIRQWQYYGSKHIPAKDILMHFMSGVLYAVLSLTTAHYIVLHLWLNIFAEILRFADRLFYEDWWTCTNYKSYFRAWNIVMYDWLYTYIYKDFYEIVLPKQKLAGKLAVFFVSSFFHDYAVSVVAGYFLPNIDMDSDGKSIKNRRNKKENAGHLDEVKDKIALQSGELPVKLFEVRESVLTELFENKHLITVYHICVSFYIGFCINSLVHDYLYDGEVRLGYNLISKGFRNIHLMFVAWFGLFFLSVVPYYGIQYWMQIRNTLKQSFLQMYLWDRLCLTFYICHLVGMLYCGNAALMKWDMGFAAGLALIMETMRLIMKVYSFGRVCISRVLNEPHKYSGHHPKFSQYMYFFFAPTLLYRDSYPRTPGNIKWRNVAIYLLEFISAIVFLSIMIDRVFVSQLQGYGSKPLPAKDLVMFVFNSAPFGLLTACTLNYILLHLWLNAFAEMLRYSDKLFYKDWWTSTSYERYYRTWNTVVHDWLYTYVYKDFVEIVCPRKKMLGKVAVFFISSIFHDFATSLAMGFFIPVFFVYFFMCGVLVGFLKIPNTLIGNVFLLYTVGLGTSMMLSVYSLEYYARLNCIKSNLTIADYFVPKMFECYK